jgi:hypothetical protein
MVFIASALCEYILKSDYQISEHQSSIDGVARQQPFRLRRCMSSDQKIRGDSIASAAAPSVVMPGLKFFLDLTTLIDYFLSRRQSHENTGHK